MVVGNCNIVSDIVAVVIKLSGTSSMGKKILEFSRDLVKMRRGQGTNHPPPNRNKIRERGNSLV